MSLRIGIAAWTVSDRPSGVRQRLLRILEQLPELLEPTEAVLVLQGRDSALRQDLPTDIECIDVDLPPGPTWRRALAERGRLRTLVETLGVHVHELGTLPVPAGLPCAVTLTVHDVRAVDGLRRMPGALARWITRRSYSGSNTSRSPVSTPPVGCDGSATDCCHRRR